jgi:hypothetical protein
MRRSGNGDKDDIEASSEPLSKKKNKGERRGEGKRKLRGRTQGCKMKIKKYLFSGQTFHWWLVSRGQRTRVKAKFIYVRDVSGI